jgi:hypothetical protein
LVGELVTKAAALAFDGIDCAAALALRGFAKISADIIVAACRILNEQFRGESFDHPERSGLTANAALNAT